MSVADPVSPASSLEEFFLRAREGSISLPRCQDCEQPHWYPMERCPYCLSSRVEWSSLGCAGTVYSATTVRFAFTAAARGQIPYGIALVVLDEAPEVRIVCRVEGTDPGRSLTPGTAVAIRVESDAGGGTAWCAPTVLRPEVQTS